MLGCMSMAAIVAGAVWRFFLGSAIRLRPRRRTPSGSGSRELPDGPDDPAPAHPVQAAAGDGRHDATHAEGCAAAPRLRGDASTNTTPERSEEQTYELQSLLRISYDVFYLKKHKSHELQHFN